MTMQDEGNFLDDIFHAAGVRVGRIIRGAIDQPPPPQEQAARNILGPTLRQLGSSGLAFSTGVDEGAEIPKYATAGLASVAAVLAATRGSTGAGVFSGVLGGHAVGNLLGLTGSDNPITPPVTQEHSPMVQADPPNETNRAVLEALQTQFDRREER